MIQDETPAASETGRLEAFSDGVFAVAITLLVLEIRVPAPGALPLGNLALLHALQSQWPSLLAYVVSFLTILVMWINHGRLFEQIHRKDHLLQIYNGLLLMLVTLIPFPTALVAEYIQTPHAQTAVVIYCALNFLMALAFNVLWRYASRDGRLLAADHDPHRVRHITERYRYGPILYGATLALAFVSVTVCVVMVAALAVFFVIPEHAKKSP